MMTPGDVVCLVGLCGFGLFCLLVVVSACRVAGDDEQRRGY